MREQAIVHIVGAGPGDPDLITVKALRLLRAADVVVYDRLVSDELLELIPHGVTRIFAGKAPGRCAITQQETNELLARLARRGHRVVRLKGGDPFIFGRGGEEARYLAERGIAFEVVPGITAAAACAAAAGIPLTHRGLSSSLHILTGHRRDSGELPDLPLDGLSRADATLVVYMGLAHVETLCARLAGAGLAPDTPAAVIERGSTPHQRRVLTTLADLPDAVREQRVEPPALLIIGRVVSLAATLSPALSADRERADRHYG